MPRFLRKPRKAAGAGPGTLVPPEISPAVKPEIQAISYSKSGLSEQTVEALHGELLAPDSMTWIHVIGVPDPSLMADLGRHLGIHDLTLEDIANTAHRPKLEEFDTYLFMAFKHLDWNRDTRTVRSAQVSLVVCENLLVSFQERAGDPFRGVRERLRTGKGRIRNSGAGYLAYALVDAVVDHYYSTLADIGDGIEDLEQEMLTSPDASHLEQVHGLKREMIYLRKQAWPVREMVARCLRSESPLLPDSLDPYFRDVYDHIIHIMDTVESFRELQSGLLDLYLSSSGNRMNEIMGVLTIIATIFIPLTFLAGIYGMNFKYMPELEWRWGYFSLLGFMVVIGGGMVVYFKRKKWL